MAIISVSHLKRGDKLNENVITQLGNVLFPKGKPLFDREIEVLSAFLILSVSIETRQGEDLALAEEAQKLEETRTGQISFFTQYNNLLKLLQRVFTLAGSGGTLPILDIRTNLENLIKLIEHYNVLTFTPPNMAINDYIYHNSIRVSLTSYVLAKWQGFLQKDLMPIALGGLFHDIGNTKIDSTLLSKVSKLSTEEVQEIKNHTVLGYNILKTVPAINEGVKLCALQHHEKEDGSGYPYGTKGDKNHIYAKIVAIADIFHAMSSNRAYRNGASPYLVLEQIAKESFGKLEPVLVQMFINRVTQFHNGTKVRLSDNSIGEIVFSDRSHPTRPMVNVNGKIINLMTERNVYIQSVIQ